MSEADAAATEPPSAESTGAMPRATDWIVRPFTVPGRSTAGIALGLFLAFVTVTWGFRVGVEGISLRELVRSPLAYLDLVNAVVFAYIAVALHLLRLGRLRDLSALRPALEADDGRFASLTVEVVNVPPRRLLRGGLVGALLLASAPVLDPGIWAGRPPPLLSPEMIFKVLQHAATGWLAGHVAVTETQFVRAFRRLGAEELRVDLLDPTPLAPIVRPGLRSALTWVLCSSLLSLFWLGPSAAQSNSFLIPAILILVLMIFFVSIAGARANIRDTKQRALDDLARAIRDRGDATLRGVPPGEGPSLADLVALHGFIERVREWPLGAPAAARGALIGLVALGSWGGAALVELFIERALGG